MNYTSWGFSDDPFPTKPLGANEEGASLLSGRKNELEKLEYLLVNEGKILRVNGSAGVGKTSLANVAAFNLLKKWRSKNMAKLVLPCIEPISVEKGENPQDFKHRIATAVLLTLKKYKSEIAALNLYSLEDYDNDVNLLLKWMSDPQAGGKGAGLSGGFAGISGGLSASLTSTFNTGDGFRRNFPSYVFSLATQALGKDGRIVVVIDNCELFEDAKKLLESLNQWRDDLFTRPTFRWVLCGADGILERIAHQRISEFMSTNVVDVSSINSKTDLHDLITRRINYYSADKKNPARLPLSLNQISALFDILGGNPRSILSKVSDYCVWFNMPGHTYKFPETEDDFSNLFDKWLQVQIENNVEDFKPLIRKKVAWGVLVKLGDRGGEARPSDYSEFGLSQEQGMANHIKTLKEAMLVDSFDDRENRKKTIYRITEKGRWTVFAWRRSTQSDIRN